MAVDVPDSFVARSKTPPRYPPPRPPQVGAAIRLVTTGPHSSQGSGASFASKNSSDVSSETAKCGDILSQRSQSSSRSVSDHKIQLLISSGEDSPDCSTGVTYSARTESVLIREAVYASYDLPPGYDTTPVLLGREVAVDVPDGFVQVVKGPPKYPGTADRKSVPYLQVKGTVVVRMASDGNLMRHLVVGITNLLDLWVTLYL